MAHKRKRKKQQIRPGCLASVIIIVLSFALLFLTPIFNVKRIEVTGIKSVSQEVILNAAGIPKGTNIFRANVKKAEENIRKQQFVEDVKVKRVLPDKIKIKVTEGSVAAYINYEDNLVGISLGGKTLCLTDKASRQENIAVIYGLSVEKSIVGENAEATEKKKLDNALKLLKSFSDMGILNMITAIDVKSTDNIAFRYTDKLKIAFGSMEDYDYKMDCLPDIIDQLGDNPEGLINMHNPENITYRNTID